MVVANASPPLSHALVVVTLALLRSRKIVVLLLLPQPKGGGDNVLGSVWFVRKIAEIFLMGLGTAQEKVITRWWKSGCFCGFWILYHWDIAALH